MKRNLIIVLLLSLCLWGCQTFNKKPSEISLSNSKPHYIEIVTEDIDEHCRLFESIHGGSFGEQQQELGGAKVLKSQRGPMIGVRAPLAEHEKPIVRVYYEVEDIQAAIQKVTLSEAKVAYPPTRQGNTGIWAIYIQGGIQYGLWQKVNLD